MYYSSLLHQKQPIVESFSFVFTAMLDKFEMFSYILQLSNQQSQKWILTHQDCTVCFPHVKSRFSTYPTFQE